MGKYRKYLGKESLEPQKRLPKQSKKEVCSAFGEKNLTKRSAGPAGINRNEKN
jgi:hypothetical protein